MRHVSGRIGALAVILLLAVGACGPTDEEIRAMVQVEVGETRKALADEIKADLLVQVAQMKEQNSAAIERLVVGGVAAVKQGPQGLPGLRGPRGFQGPQGAPALGDYVERGGLSLYRSLNLSQLQFCLDSLNRAIDEMARELLYGYGLYSSPFVSCGLIAGF